MLYKISVGYFVLKLHTHTLWGHQRFILHLVKIAFYHPFKKKKRERKKIYHHFPEKQIFLSVFVMVKFVCGIIQFLVK